MLHALRLLAVFYRTSVQTDMEYRADFFTRVIASLLGLLTTAGSLTVAFQYTSNLKGWTLPHVLVLLAVYYSMDGLIEMFIAPNMREIMTQVREGTLDFVLLKPVSAQFMATFRTLNIWRAGNLLIGIGLAVYSIGRLSLNVGPGQALAFAVTLAAGIAVVYSFWLVLVTLTFWFVRLDNLEQIVWQAFEAGRYPVAIYPAWLRAVLTYVIPVAFIISVPAQALTGKVGLDFVPVALLVAIGSLAASSAFWRFGLKHYTGASA
ncbi:MAG TPA: ABC-2 family transporter protein [Armatimonadota bacterium]|nr:ABC-2 family transporter protein [Armatimonadota bacterium]